jgi:GT2 family glycosyltransferase
MKFEERITVILVAYHGDQWITKCIYTLRKASRRAIRLLMVDNVGNSCIDNLDLSDFNAKILKCSSPLGFAEANNFALINGGLETEFVCFLNQDTLSTKGWLDACVQCLASNSEIGALVPLVATYDGQGWDPNFLECANLSRSFCNDWDSEGQLKGWYSVPRIPAVAMVARTGVIKKVGPFDPIYGSYYEDYDLCARIQKAGYNLGVCTQGQIAHYSGSATSDRKKEKKRMCRIICNRAIMDVRFNGKRNLAFLKYMFYHFPRRLARAVVNKPSSQPVNIVLKAWKDFILLAPRMVSAKSDRLAWEKYLSEISWPGQARSQTN